MKLTSSTSTGHLAMSQAVTAASPRPITLPTCSASGPVRTTATAPIETRMIITSVIAIWTGRSFQNGRPSSTS